MDRAISGFKEAKKEFHEAEKWETKALNMQNAFVNGNRALKVQNSYTEAKKAYDSGLATDPSNTVYMAKLYLARAVLQESYDKIKEAIEDCTSCIELDSNNYKA